MKILLGLLFILTFIAWLFSFVKYIICYRKENISKAQFWVNQLLLNSIILNVLSLGIQCVK